ncbi:MAG: YraN family protein [Acutalibacteraceae bacterium]
MNTRQFGSVGEDIVTKYLIKNRCEIVKRNYYTKYGEIDIIAKNSKYILFVEVKTRRETAIISPCEAVNKKKQQCLFKTAHIFLRDNPIKLYPRFDVAEVILDSKSLKCLKLNYIKNAFWQEGSYAPF